MNKSLLIIICDFLLISVLALVEFKPQTEIDSVDPQSIRQQAAEEMLELLQLSLEHENAQRETVEAALQQREQVLSEREADLQQTRSELEEVSAALTQTSEEKASLASRLDETALSLQATRREREALADDLQRNLDRAQQLQQELAAQQELARNKAEDLNAARQALEQLESQQQQMATELRIRDTEKQMLEQNLIAAKAEVERARIEAERAERRAENLAMGVSELAASSSALQEEIRQAQPLSQNQIYQQFADNRVFIRFNWEERLIFGSTDRESTLQSVLVRDASGVHAVFATPDTPLDGRETVQIRATLGIGGRSFTIQEVARLEADRRIAAVRIPDAIVSSSGLKPFLLAGDPLRFANAVLVRDNQELYGEIPIRIPPGEPGYLEVATRLFNRLFGEFAPSAGDYVFSLTGELTGIMVSSERARILDSLEAASIQKLDTQP